MKYKVKLLGEKLKQREYGIWDTQKKCFTKDQSEVFNWSTNKKSFALKIVNILNRQN